MGDYSSGEGDRDGAAAVDRAARTLLGRRRPRQVVALTAAFAAENPDDVRAPAIDRARMEAPFCCGGCGACWPIGGEFIAAHAGEIIEACCLRCGTATIARCPEDLGPVGAPSASYRFWCSTPGCLQRFCLARTLGADLARRLDGATFQQSCASCHRSVRVRVPEDLRRVPAQVSRHPGDSLRLEEDDQQSPRAECIAPGTWIDAYRVRALIAEGGAGMVYRCRSADGRLVAVKVLKRFLSERGQMRERFHQEVRLISRLRHPNVVRLLDHGELSDHRLYLVMELLDGASLCERMGDHLPLGRDETFSIFTQLCQALATVHEQGVVHRDLKPENVILKRCALGPTQVTLIDFGVAKVLATSCSMPVLATAQGMLVGSPRYMAPEQIQSACVDHRADVYALGLMMYEAFTGAWPWPEQPMAFWAQLAAHVEQSPAVDHRLRRRCRPMSDLVMGCLQKDASARPRSAEEVRVRLLDAWRRWPLTHVGAPDLHGSGTAHAAVTRRAH